MLQILIYIGEARVREVGIGGGGRARALMGGFKPRVWSKTPSGL